MNDWRAVIQEVRTQIKSYITTNKKFKEDYEINTDLTL